MAGLRFRPAGEHDVASVVRLVEWAYRGEASRAGWTTEASLLDGQRTDAEEVSALIGRPASTILLAESGAAATPELVACCHLEHRSPDTAWFGMFAVAPGHQGSGIGRTMLEKAGTMAAAWGCRKMRMAVIRQREDLIAWYHRRGYEPTGLTEPFPYGDVRFGIPRRDDLEFVVLEGLVQAAAGPDRPVGA